MVAPGGLARYARSALATGVHLRAAARCSSKGRAGSTSVVNARFVKPLDTESLARLARGHEIMVTVEDNALAGGEDVATLVSEEGAGCAVLRFGLPDCFVEHGKIRELHQAVGMTGEDIATRVLELLGEGDAGGEA